MDRQFIFSRIIQHAIEELGGSLADVIRTRIYVTDIAQWESIGRAHGEYFRLIRPGDHDGTSVKIIGPRIFSGD
jgi:enamine deaminase RidA (YjgF/YER057c/UK114 family)